MGVAAGERVLVLRLDGQMLEEVTVSLAPGASDTLDQDILLELAPGEHVVEVEGVSATFQVPEPASEAVSPVVATPEVTPTFQEATLPGPTAEAALAPAQTGPQDAASEGGGLSGGVLAGIIGGVAVVLGALTVGIVLLRRRRESPASE